ncbi:MULTISPECIES: hypothetical protein [unclassified Gemella]|uniref:hypothetical protein n=1 Tax=unclassified Gemella TaxID=2624949 RepID=UPI001C053A70|nr:MULTISPECIES: hypothetical protein [unclassified Gemella]MBU0278663.1 hypothetical protein [Gemella sp. zg-1178]QWQ39218.1 hypothetical protein KMP11_02500 [Gemella sp. zg-570]
MKWKEYKEKLEELEKEDYENYIKAIISIEKGIDDEKVLDSIYNEYLNSPCNLLNDMFDEMLI